MKDAIQRLVDIQYERNEVNLVRGKFRVRGDTLEVFPSYEETLVRVQFWGDEVERIIRLNPVTGEVVDELSEVFVFPATHYVTERERMKKAIAGIEVELAERLAELERKGKMLEAQRLRMRTNYDLEMMREVGFCSGIENYSRYLDGRSEGEAPYTLLDYFPKNYLTIVDESHVTVPQIGGQYEGDHSRKEVLVEHGFRLPSAKDNRPLRFDEWLEKANQVVFLSATPSEFFDSALLKSRTFPTVSVIAGSLSDTNLSTLSTILSTLIEIWLSAVTMSPPATAATSTGGLSEKTLGADAEPPDISI